MISGLQVLSLFSILTHECKLESDCPSNTDPNEAPDEDPFVKQQDADFIQANARPDLDFQRVGRRVQVSRAPSFISHLIERYTFPKTLRESF